MGKYSQKDEDSYILRAVVNMPTGRFLDIGAYDGYHYSNTMCLVELGWSGVMVEPGLEAFQALLKQHGGNQNIRLIHAAVGLKAELISFWNNPTTFSTTSEFNRFNKFPHEGFSQMYFVPQITLDGLPGPFDVVSIDTEGTSVELFHQALLRLRPLPKVVAVEHDNNQDACMEWARLYEYTLMMANEENLVFRRD